RDLTRLNTFVHRIIAAMMPTMMLVMNALTVGIVWFGSQYVDAGSMQIGDMMAFIQYAMQIIMSFLMVSMAFVLLPRASVSAERSPSGSRMAGSQVSTSLMRSAET
ncbi:ABC transporter transmembrane domain-containing protein, partial [Bittarella massiliensis (ex Durand et al. 2017)]